MFFHVFGILLKKFLGDKMWTFKNPLFWNLDCVICISFLSKFYKFKSQGPTIEYFHINTLESFKIVILSLYIEMYYFGMWDWLCHLYHFFEQQYHGVKNTNFVQNCTVMWQNLSSFKKFWLKEVLRRPFIDQSIKYKHVSKCHVLVTSNEHVHMQWKKNT